MKITSLSIQEKNKERCNLYIDGEFKSGVSLETVIKKQLKVGMELSIEDLNQIVLDDERVVALKKGIDYVSKLLKTKWQVKDYLVKKGFSEDISWYVVDKLKDYGYVDDVAYAKTYIELHSKNQGERLIFYKLIQKGIKKEDIEKAYENTEVCSQDNAKSVVEKYMRSKEKTKENKAKAYKYLLGKGFSFEDAENAVSSIYEEQ